MVKVRNANETRHKICLAQGRRMGPMLSSSWSKTVAVQGGSSLFELPSRFATASVSIADSSSSAVINSIEDCFVSRFGRMASRLCSGSSRLTVSCFAKASLINLLPQLVMMNLKGRADESAKSSKCCRSPLATVVALLEIPNDVQILITLSGRQGNVAEVVP